MPSLTASLGVLSAAGRLLARVIGAAPLSRTPDPEAAALVREGDEAYRAGNREHARRCYLEALGRRKSDLGALRGLRAVAVDAGAWTEALGFAERALAMAGVDRASDAAWLATTHYELGRAEARLGQPQAAVPHFRAALRADRGFLPAALALGEAYESAGDAREAVRTWERAVEQTPALPLLLRLERAYRQEGRPSRMIALYRAAVERAPDDLALAVALGRVYFELEMLDEAADQFEKVEVRAPDLPVVHAFLGAVFEHRGETREALEEYRRALRMSGGFDWPQRCTACGWTSPAWQDRCPRCGRWNALRPADGR
jgi:tetratricopeptide (TPR) repeat protein